jgi:predicted hydrocarbon binding protein
VKLENDFFENISTSFYKRFNGHLYVGDIKEQDKKSLSLGLYNDYKYGYIYPHFYGFEKYIKEVLCEIVKDTSQTNRINIFFCYNSELNLTMDAFGNLRVYVGAFNYLNNEAELASILGHEFGHYFNKDGINEFADSKMAESSADFLSIKLLKNSKYSLTGISNVFKAFKREEIKLDLIAGNNTFSKRNISHPDPGDRLKQVKILNKDSLNISRKNYIVDSVKFQQLKRIASQESYNIMMCYGDYHNVIELAFRDYLYTPNDLEILALLNEALRRYLLLHPENLSKQFIINEYKGKGAKKSNNYEWIDDSKTSILSYLNKGLLFLKSNDLTKIEAKELLDSSHIKFTTYKEAANYFANIALEKKCAPCAVSELLKSEANLKYDDLCVQNNTVFDCNALFSDLKSKPDLKEILIVINTPKLDCFDYYDEQQRKEYFDYLDKLVSKVKEFAGTQNVYLQKDLPVDDIHLFNIVDNLSETIVDPELYENAIYANMKCYNNPNLINLINNQHITRKQKVNWFLSYPEAYGAFHKYHAKDIYFINFDFLKFDKTNLGFYGVPVTTSVAISNSWQFKKVSINAKQLNIFYRHDISITRKTLDECFVNCLEQLKWFYVK